MLNYIRAELWKVARRRYLWVFLATMLLLESLFALLWTGRGGFSQLVLLCATTLPLGLLLPVFFADMVFSGQYKAGCLKNEISFGLPRRRIYLGKLYAALLVALFSCGVVLGYYLGFAWLISQPEDWPVSLGALADLGWSVAAALPLWLGRLGIAMAAYFIIRNEIVAVTLYTCSMTVGVWVLGLLAMLTINPLAGVMQALLDLLPVSRFGMAEGTRTVAFLIQNWAIGLGWFAASTALGMWVFQRRQIP